MRFERAIIDIRPRRIFEILDLSLRFYRAHLGRLLGTVVLFALPAVSLGFTVYYLFDSLLFGGLVFFFVMPVSSHAVVLAASRLVFGTEIGLSELRALYRPVWLSLFFRRLLQRILWVPLFPLVAGEIIRLGYVFSPMIVLLERLTGLPGTLRRKSLNREGGVRAFVFDLAVAFTALVLVVALAFFADLVASDIVDIWEFGGLFEDVASSAAKVTLWLVFFAVISPVVDLAWFFFYLDTRIRKEGWDLELGFKAMAKRLKPRVNDAA